MRSSRNLFDLVQLPLKDSGPLPGLSSSLTEDKDEVTDEASLLLDLETDQQAQFGLHCLAALRALILRGPIALAQPSGRATALIPAAAASVMTMTTRLVKALRLIDQVRETAGERRRVLLREFEAMRPSSKRPLGGNPGIGR